jgi:hypothetical protein
MNNLYQKVTVASVCTALGFALGANKEASSATFTLTDTRFVVEGDSYSGGGEKVLDSEGYFGPGSISVQRIGDYWSGTTSTTVRRAFYDSILAICLLPPIQLLAVLFFRLAFRMFSSSVILIVLFIWTSLAM